MFKKLIFLRFIIKSLLNICRTYFYVIEEIEGNACELSKVILNAANCDVLKYDGNHFHCSSN